MKKFAQTVEGNTGPIANAFHARYKTVIDAHLKEQAAHSAVHHTSWDQTRKDVLSYVRPAIAADVHTIAHKFVSNAIQITRFPPSRGYVQ